MKKKINKENVLISIGVVIVAVFVGMAIKGSIAEMKKYEELREKAFESYGVIKCQTLDCNTCYTKDGEDEISGLKGHRNPHFEELFEAEYNKKE